MIGSYSLKELLNKYGVDYRKVITNNDRVLTYGEYEEINKVLDYLINEKHVPVKSIEECPSIMYFNVNSIEENYNFLINNNINKEDINYTLSVLNTEPNILKETYEYLLENYGIDRIRRTLSVLTQSVSRIKEIEKILDNKDLVMSAAYNFNLNIDEIKRIIEVCKENNIEITGSVFLKHAKQLESSIEFLKNNYGLDYVKPLIIIYSKEHLKEVFDWLEEHKILEYIKNSYSILSLKLDEIKDRAEYINSIGESLVTSNGKFNSIFGMSKKNYLKRIEQNENKKEVRI